MAEAWDTSSFERRDEKVSSLFKPFFTSKEQWPYGSAYDMLLHGQDCSDLLNADVVPGLVDYDTQILKRVTVEGVSSR